MSRSDVLADLRERDRRESVASRPVPPVEPQGFDWPADAPPAHQLVASGVTSHVYGPDRQTLGHVTMTEYDETDPRSALAAADASPSTAVAVRSSPSNYHVVDLGVRPWSDALDLADRLGGSDSYRSEMSDQGRFVLRDTPKYRKTGDRYKPAPEPVYVAPGDGERALSRPHLDVIRDLAQDAGRERFTGRLAGAVSRLDVTGETTTRSTYESMSDALSEVLADG